MGLGLRHRKQQQQQQLTQITRNSFGVMSRKWLLQEDRACLAVRCPVQNGADNVCVFFPVVVGADAAAASEAISEERKRGEEGHTGTGTHSSARCQLSCLHSSSSTFSYCYLSLLLSFFDSPSLHFTVTVISPDLHKSPPAALWSLSGVTEPRH